MTNNDVTTDLQVWNSIRDRSTLRQPVFLTRGVTSAGQRPDSYVGISLTARLTPTHQICVMEFQRPNAITESE
jgi:hypothetical protein